MEQSDSKQYIAFISYKRDDEQAAMWLQEAIESFKLPTELIDRNLHLEEFQKRYVFRDKTDMSSGVLPEVIKMGLEQSHYLIVICSRIAVTSPWVNKEIRYFLSLHEHDYTKVIPFIIDGIPYSKEYECLPEAIREIPENKELLAINLNDSIWDEDYKQIASVKVISYMLGLNFDTLWDRHKRREEKERKRKIEERHRYQRLESKYLCEMAEDYFSKGEYTQAYQSVLLALPSDLKDADDRPYVVEAERMLRRFLHHNISFPEIYDITPSINQWAISHNRKLVATADGVSGKIRLWNAIDKSLIKEIPSYLGELNVFIFSNNDTHLLISSYTSDAISLVDINTGRICFNIRTNKPTHADLSTDGKLILAISSHNTISLWDVESKTSISTMGINYTNRIIKAEFSRNGRYIKTITDNNEESVWNLSTQKREDPSKRCLFDEKTHEYLNKYEASVYFQKADKKLYTLQRFVTDPCRRFNSHEPVYIDCSPDGAIAASFTDPMEIVVWGTYTNSSHIVLRGHQRYVFYLRFSHNGKMLVSIDYDYKVKIWNIRTGECIEEIYMDEKEYDYEILGIPLSAEFSKDDHYLLIYYYRHCDLWDINARDYKSKTYYHNLHKQLISISEDNTVVKRKFPVKLDTSTWYHSAISHDKQLIAVMTSTEINIYESNNGDVISNIKYNFRRFNSISFSSDSYYIVTSSDSSIVIWNIQDGNPIHAIEEDSMNFKNAKLCTSNKILYASSEDVILILEHKPLQELITELRYKYHISSIE